MYTTLDPKNKMSMIFVGLALTTILFVTLNMIMLAKSSVNDLLEKVEEAQCKCDDQY
tara:strand:+ start:2729 stop:2899 length:171 start_codon:yes stop_codon:yes gene_type:complete